MKMAAQKKADKKTRPVWSSTTAKCACSDLSSIQNMWKPGLPFVAVYGLTKLGI